MNFESREFRGVPLLSYSEGPPNGPTMLLLHGVTRCWQDWEPLLPALTSAWRVVAIDHRGHGGSGRANRYCVTDFVEDIVRFVSQEISAPLVILGHSLGAMVAAAVAADVPELVRGVVLEDPPFLTMGNRINGTAWQAQFRGMRDVAQCGGTKAEMAARLAEIEIPAPGGVSKRLGELRTPAALAWSAECLAKLDPEVLTPIIDAGWMDGFDFTEVLSRIRCPVLLLQADPLCGGALANHDVDAALAALPSIQHFHFPGAGHQLHRDRTDAMLVALKTFFDTLSGTI